MATQLTHSDVACIASLELNLLNYSKALPKTALQGSVLETGTPIYDINGEILFYRFPLSRDGSPAGYADAAANSIFGAPLLAVSPSAVWDEQAVVEAAREALLAHAREKPPFHDYDEIRIVAYSYPKIAVQFLHEKKEVAMLECYTWINVPHTHPKTAAHKPLEKLHFERWSLIDGLPQETAEQNHKKFEERIALGGQPEFSGLTRNLVSIGDITPLPVPIMFSDTWEMHYSPISTSHKTCFELKGQETNVWCVAASMQMLLDFYRYNYTQTKIAQQMGLGTPTNPNGLPYSRVGDVVTQLQVMSSNALTAKMITSPTFSDFTSEIKQNRPMISFIPGHSRAVAGYTWSIFPFPGGFRGLLVFDPWPPTPVSTPNTGGIITRWENFDTQTYQYAYTAQVHTI
jgi:hypothetical protein